jgi:hypothetical protein
VIERAVALGEQRVLVGKRGGRLLDLARLPLHRAVGLRSPAGVYGTVDTCRSEGSRTAEKRAAARALVIRLILIYNTLST